MGFEVSPEEVRYSGARLRRAEAATFRVLSQHFGADANAVWVINKPFEGAPAALRVLLEPRDGPTAYASDGVHVYRTNPPQIVKKLDARTFVLLDETFGRDASVVFCLPTERVVRGATPDTFEALGGGYGRCGAAHYFQDTRLAGVKTLSVLGSAFAASAGAVYWRGDVIDGAAPHGARVHGDYLVTKEGVWWRALPLAQCKPATFRAVGQHFGTDGLHAFVHHERIDGADAASFGEPSAHREALLVEADVLEERGLSDAAAKRRTPQADEAAALDATTYFALVEGTLVRAPRLPSKPLSPNAALQKWWARLEHYLWPLTRRPHAELISYLHNSFDERWRPETEPGPTSTRATLEGAQLVVRRADLVLETSLAAFLHPVLRFRDGAGVLPLISGERLGVSDRLRLHALEYAFVETLAVVDACAGKVPAEELAQLVDLLDLTGWRKHNPEATVAVAQRRLRYGLSPAPGFVNVSASTNLSALKEAAVHPWRRSERVRERLALQRFIQKRLADLYDAKARWLAGLGELFLESLDDAAPFVRELACENAAFVAHLLDGEAPTPTHLALARALLSRGIDPDVNSARIERFTSK